MTGREEGEVRRLLRLGTYTESVFVGGGLGLGVWRCVACAGGGDEAKEEEDAEADEQL